MSKLIIVSGSDAISATQLARMLIGVDAAVVTRGSISVHQMKVSDFIGFDAAPTELYSNTGKQKAQWKTERAFYKRK